MARIKSMAKNHIKVKFTFICLVKNLGVQNFLMVLEFFVLCSAFWLLAVGVSICCLTVVLHCKKNLRRDSNIPVWKEVHVYLERAM